MIINILLSRLSKYRIETCLFVLVAVVSFIDLEHYPPAWWDEGWTLMVARNWVEQGHYGLYQDGLPRDAGLSGHFPMVAMVALSFRLFGIGIWQGRLPVAFITLAVFVLLYYFSNKWWGRRVALGTMFTCLILCAPQVNILYYGRQILGEIPAVFFLLAGYACLEIAFERHRFWLIATSIFWGLCLAVKSQPLPFWLASIILYIVACIISRQRRKSGWIVLAAIGAILIYQLSAIIPATLTKSILNTPKMIQGLMSVTGFVVDINVRRLAAWMVINYGLPTLLGLCWSGWHLLHELKNSNKLINPVIWAIWGFAASWFAWYLLLAQLWIRYLFPAVVIGSPFIAASLANLTQGYDLKWIFRQSARLLTGREKQIGIQAIFCILLLTLALTVSLKMNFINFRDPAMYNPQAAALKLQEIIPDNALVETYESEIMFLAPDVKFHYPPDQISVEAWERLTVDPGRTLDYDPGQASPDYLLVGFFGDLWKVYYEAINQGVFKLQESFYGYDLYYRVP
jgi:dolichyl-phosphate-mannose--protein O-mannosyl transferase